MKCKFKNSFKAVVLFAFVFAFAFVFQLNIYQDLISLLEGAEACAPSLVTE